MICFADLGAFPLLFTGDGKSLINSRSRFYHCTWVYLLVESDIALVNVYVDLLVFMRIAGTS